MSGRIFLHTPGPTNIPDRILRAMHRPAEDFAAPEFTGVLSSCLEDLKGVFGTAGEVFAYSSNGHGSWEAALVNFLEPGDTVLVGLAGRFSGAWAEMAEHLGLKVETTPVQTRRAVDPDHIEEALRADVKGRIKAVLVVYTETATSTRGDIEAVRAAIDRAGHDALLMVDAIGALAIEPFSMDAWGVDVTLSASQKGLMLPPGLCFIAVGEKAMRIAERCTMPRRYWDMQFRRGELTYQWFHGTPPLQMVWGLREALDMLAEEGLDATIARHARLAGATRAAVEAWSAGGALSFNAELPAQRSNAVTAIRVAPGVDPDALRVLARERFNLALGGGLGELQGTVFRIGHLGDLNEPMILGALATTELCLRLCGIPHEPGMEAALAALSAAAA